MKLKRVMIGGLVICLLTGALPGCSDSFPQTNPVTEPSSYPGVIARAKKTKKDFVMYSGKDIYKVLSVQLDRKKKEMTVQLDKLDSVNKTTNVPQNVPRVYFFMKDSTSYTLDEPHTIPLARVSKIALEDEAN